MPQQFKKLTPWMTGLIPTILIGGGTASAEMIGPGGVASDFNTSLANRPDLGGDIEAKNFIPFTLKDDFGNNIYTGHLLHEVVRDAQSGTLSFYYRFMNKSNDIFGIEDAIAGQFKNYKTDVEVLTDSGGQTSPTDIDRSLGGSNITFDFDPEGSRITPGGDSLTFLVKTNSTEFDSHGDVDIHAFTAASTDEGGPILDEGEADVSTFRPIGEAKAAPSVTPPTPPAAVPLPSPFLAGLSTMVVGGLYMRRLRKPARA